MKKILILIIGLFLFSCTEQERVKSFGGKMSVTIPEGYYLVNMTFKETNLWLLVRNRKNPCNWMFYEESSFGIMEGKIYIESCDDIPKIEPDIITPVDTLYK